MHLFHKRIAPWFSVTKEIGAQLQIKVKADISESHEPFFLKIGANDSFYFSPVCTFLEKIVFIQMYLENIIARKWMRSTLSSIETIFSTIDSNWWNIQAIVCTWFQEKRFMQLRDIGVTFYLKLRPYLLGNRESGCYSFVKKMRYTIYQFHDLSLELFFSG